MGLCLRLPILQFSWSQIAQFDCFVQQSQEGFSPHGSSDQSGVPVQFLLADSGAGKDSMPYTSVDYCRAPTALVVGSEACGISMDALSVLSGGKGVGWQAQRIHIPMARSLESFNAAVAGSIILAEAHRQREEACRTAARERRH